MGTFLEVDPVEGGSCTDYDYVCGDPVNGFDLDGTCGSWMSTLQRIACQQDAAKRSAAAKQKAAKEAAARARLASEKDKRMDVVKPVPRNNPMGDYLGWALKNVVGNPISAAKS